MLRSLREELSMTSQSCLTPQIFGAYRLQMYAAQIFFFVSRNVLWSPPRDLPSPLRVDIFDLKESTYGRQFKPPPTGTRVKWRHCNNSYQIGYPPPPPSLPSPVWRRSREMEECMSYRRIHEPTGVRKDNDFFSRLPLLEEDSDRLTLQVTRDLDFLSERLQVMDYSWLGSRLTLLPTERALISPSPRCVSGNYLSVLVR
jgi:hypothetical protein